MFCERCGHKRGQEDKFCAYCGTSLIEGNMVRSERSVPVQKPTQNIEQYDRIRGWLYLVGFGLFVTPFILAYGIFDSFSLLSDSSMSQIDNFVPGLANAVRFELIMDTALFFTVMYLIFLFREKSRLFPKYFMWYLVVSIAYLVIDYTLVASLTTSSSEMRDILDTTVSEQAVSITGAILGSLIWIAYIQKSKRVAGTFTK